MSNNFRCGGNDCHKNIPPHLRHISCFACKTFFHVRCCNVNKKDFDNLKNSGENWLCFKCRPKEPTVQCGSCRKPIPKTNVVIQCLFCDNFFIPNAPVFLSIISGAHSHGHAPHVFLKKFHFPH